MLLILQKQKLLKMDRREKLLAAVCGKDLDGNSVRYADATIKLILSDMAKEYIKFWRLKVLEPCAFNLTTLNEQCSG